MVIAPKWCSLGLREQTVFFEAVCRGVSIPIMLQDADFTGSCYRMQPYLVFALQHLEVAIQIEKRVLFRRGVFPSDRLREPTLKLDETYEQQMDGLVELMVGLCNEAKAGLAARA